MALVALTLEVYRIQSFTQSGPDLEKHESSTPVESASDAIARQVIIGPTTIHKGNEISDVNLGQPLTTTEIIEI
jgi:hypothetical protein